MKKNLIADTDERANYCSLIHDIATGDETALQALYDATMSRVFTVALRITGNSSAAEEIVENVFFQVWRTAGSFDIQRGSPLTWLFVICRSHALSYLRNANTDLPSSAADALDTELESDDEKSDPQSLLIAIEKNAGLHVALQKLPQLDRQLISLAFFRDMTYPEIATHMLMPLGTVKSRIRRALLRLRELLYAMEMRG